MKVLLILTLVLLDIVLFLAGIIMFTLIRHFRLKTKSWKRIKSEYVSDNIPEYFKEDIF